MQPLAGKRVLITRAADQAGEFSRLLAERGAVVMECPTISLVPPDCWDELDAAINRLDDFDWLVLTSVNGVRFFFDRLGELGRHSSSLGHCKVCVVGPRTAELVQTHGIVPALLPDQFTGEGVLAALSASGVAGKRVLFPRADGAREVIVTGLTGLGAVVTAPVVYCNRMPQQLDQAARKALEQRELDVITFSAPSTVRNLATLLGGATRLGELLEGVVVASIGPVTSRACRELGLPVTVEPQRATLADLADSLETYFCNHAVWKSESPAGQPAGLFLLLTAVLMPLVLEQLQHLGGHILAADVVATLSQLVFNLVNLLHAYFAVGRFHLGHLGHQVRQLHMKGAFSPLNSAGVAAFFGFSGPHHRLYAEDHGLRTGVNSHSCILHY